MTIHHFAPFTEKGDQGARSNTKKLRKEPDTEDNKEALSFLTGKGDQDSTINI